MDNIFVDFSSELLKSLYVISVPSSLNEEIAINLMNKVCGTNGNSKSILDEIKSYPIWHTRTNRTWSIDEDIREYALKHLNGNAKDIRVKTLNILKESRQIMRTISSRDLKDLELQIARLSFTIEDEEAPAVETLRQFYDIADTYHNPETSRVISEYIDENISPEKVSAFPSHILSAFYMKGMHEYREKNYFQAIRYLEPVWKQHVETLQSITDAAIASHIIGVIWSRDYEKFHRSEGAYQSSINLGEQIGHTYHLAQVYHSLGNLLSKDRRRWADAEKAYQSSLDLGKQINDSYVLAQVYHSLGNLLSKDRKRWADAEKAYQKSINLGGQIDHTYGLAQVYHSLGNLLSKDRKRWADAEDAYNRSLNLKNHFNDPWEEAQVFHSLGLLLSMDTLRFEEAEDAFNKSLELGKHNIHHLAQAYQSLGNLLGKIQGRWEDAENAYQLSYEYNKQNSYQKGIAITCTSYGRLLIKINKYDKAKKYLKIALENERIPYFRDKILNILQDIE